MLSDSILGEEITVDDEQIIVCKAQLYTAAVTGNTAAVERLLLQHGILVDTLCNNGKTAL